MISNDKYHNPGRGPLHVNIDQSGLHTGLSHDGLHLTSEVVETVAGWGGYGDGMLNKIYFDDCLIFSVILIPETISKNMIQR